MVGLCWFCDAGSVDVFVYVGVFVCIRGKKKVMRERRGWVGFSFAFVDGEEKEKKKERNVKLIKY